MKIRGGERERERAEERERVKEGKRDEMKTYYKSVGEVHRLVWQFVVIDALRQDADDVLVFSIQGPTCVSSLTAKR